MNILIKGLEIPENGYLDVRILNHSGLEMAAVTWNDSGCYPYAEAHNVVVLPERHGRLVDADEFMADICNSINEMSKIGIMVDGDYLWCKLNDALENAPTIVEAEGGCG